MSASHMPRNLRNAIGAIIRRDVRENKNNTKNPIAMPNFSVKAPVNARSLSVCFVMLSGKEKRVKSKRGRGDRAELTTSAPIKSDR